MRKILLLLLLLQYAIVSILSNACAREINFNNNHGINIPRYYPHGDVAVDLVIVILITLPGTSIKIFEIRRHVVLRFRSRRSIGV